MNEQDILKECLNAPYYYYAFTFSILAKKRITMLTSKMWKDYSSRSRRNYLYMFLSIFLSTYNMDVEELCYETAVQVCDHIHVLLRTDKQLDCNKIQDEMNKKVKFCLMPRQQSRNIDFNEVENLHAWKNYICKDIV